MLYPLKFKPILKSMLWGGTKLAGAGRKLPRGIGPDTPIGESWEISGVAKNISVASNGFLKSNNLQELAEVYMGELVGDDVYEKYGDRFPVLVKFIDACQTLSVQVHPNDELALARHGKRGKTEMWYVVDCEPGAFIYLGFKRRISQQEYIEALEAGRLADLLERYDVRRGDAYYIPAGTVHAIGGGILIAEIQQASDVTYRIDDWGRLSPDGEPRQLHREEALSAIDFDYREDYKRVVLPVDNSAAGLVESPYFTVNVLNVNGRLDRDYSSLDSFVVYVCTEGEVQVIWEGGSEKLSAMESLLIPAELDEITLSGKATVLEVHM